MINICVMIKPASSLCNMRCGYCFYSNIADIRTVSTYGIMQKNTLDKVLNNIRHDLSDGDTITFAFQGGEPTLASLEWYQYFVDQVSKWSTINIQYTLQTNATLLDDEWCDFLRRNNFLVGISWDILPGYHDRVRIDQKDEGTNNRVISSIDLLDKYNVEYNILCTLTNDIALRPDKVWKQLEKYDIKYVQFTPCLSMLGSDNLSETPSPYALTPRSFASFYQRIFELWYDDFSKGNYKSIKLFDDIVNLLAYNAKTACGINGTCSPQMIIEADGSAFPCDFYCIDKYRLGNLATDSLTVLYNSDTMKDFLNRSHNIPGLCSTCRFKTICNGGCKRMVQNICCCSNDGYCGYREFLSKNIKEIKKICFYIKNKGIITV